MSIRKKMASGGSTRCTTPGPDATPRENHREANPEKLIEFMPVDRTDATLIIAAGCEESKCRNTQTRACHEKCEHLFTPSGATFSFGCSAAITQGRRDAPTWMQQTEETDGERRQAGFVNISWEGSEMVQHTEILQYLRPWQDFG